MKYIFFSLSVFFTWNLTVFGGIENSADTHLLLSKNKLQQMRQGNWYQLKKEYPEYLSPISVGRVKNVISGNLIQLENGLKVQLIGLEVPSVKDSRKGFQCFGVDSQAYLSSLILGERVFLVSDRVQATSHQSLLRYVYLPTYHKGGDFLFVNQVMLEAGYARSYWPGKNQYFRSEFEALEGKMFNAPLGAWMTCLENLFQ